MFVIPRRLRFTEEELRKAIAASTSWSEVLRRLGYRSAGGNWKTLKKYVQRWKISTEHFDPMGSSLAGLKAHWKAPIPLGTILVRDSSYHRGHLKERLFKEGLKARECELCGQGEQWRGQRMALILDHINGVPNDHRLKNLRIICPNCAATLATHCGRKNKRPEVACDRCGSTFQPKYRSQRFCTRDCGVRYERDKSEAARKVARPPYAQLMRELAATSYSAVGRKYGVSDNAVRKWVRFYEGEPGREPGDDAKPDA